MTASNLEPYEHALEALRDGRLPIGEPLTASFFYGLFRIPEWPEKDYAESSRAYAKRCQQWSMRMFVPHMERLKVELRDRYGLWLHRYRRSGYMISSSEAVDVVANKAVKDAKQSIADAAIQVKAFSLCADEGRQRYITDTANHLARLHMMLGREHRKMPKNV